MPDRDAVRCEALEDAIRDMLDVLVGWARPMSDAEKFAALKSIGEQALDPQDPDGDRPAAEPRGWVRRLGAYLRIFGVRRPYTDCDAHYYEHLVEMAKEREAEHGR